MSRKKPVDLLSWLPTTSPNFGGSLHRIEPAAVAGAELLLSGSISSFTLGGRHWGDGGGMGQSSLETSAHFIPFKF